MKKILIFILIISLSSCSVIMHVNRHSSIGISSEVKKELIKAEKRIRKERRVVNRIYNKQERKYNKLQRKRIW